MPLMPPAAIDNGIPHSEFAQDESQCLSEGTAQTQEDAPERIIKPEFPPAFGFLRRILPF